MLVTCTRKAVRRASSAGRAGEEKQRKTTSSVATPANVSTGGALPLTLLFPRCVETTAGRTTDFTVASANKRSQSSGYRANVYMNVAEIKCRTFAAARSNGNGRPRTPGSYSLLSRLIIRPLLPAALESPKSSYKLSSDPKWTSLRSQPPFSFDTLGILFSYSNSNIHSFTNLFTATFHIAIRIIHSKQSPRIKPQTERTVELEPYKH